jgi:nicotinate-nucleotide adenylyltransferase
VKSERIGVFGGTFDPLHNGHVMVALEVRAALELDRMMLVVANDPWQKDGDAVSPAPIRLDMTERAVSDINKLAGEALLEVSEIEIRRGGESYTADTLAELHRQHPDAELFLLVGSDAADGLPSWKRPDEVRDLATTVVVDRGGRDGGRPPAGWPHEVVEVEMIDISSSDIRERIRTEKTVDDLIPRTVVDDVANYELYGVSVVDDVPTETEPAEPPAPPSRRRPAPPANPFFRFVFPLLIVMAGAVVFLLWREGTKAVLDTTDGQEVPVVRDPLAPGFLAFTTPTPTLIVAHTDNLDRLVGVSVLAQTIVQEGGASLTLLSRDLLLENETQVFLGQLYEEDGIEALEAAVAEWMGAGFTDDPMIMSTDRLASFFEQVEPIPFVLVDDLVVETDDGIEVVIEAGARDFSAQDLAAVYGWLNPGEPDATRFDRQLDVWRAWLGEIEQVAATGDPADLIAATLPFNDGLPPYLRGMATGTADISLPPMAPFWIDPDSPLYALEAKDLAWPTDRALATIPLPIAHAPGARPSVQVLDGTGDANNRAAAIPAIVAAGAEITIVGNAREFGVEATVVSYHVEENVAIAESFGAALGVDVRFDPNLNEVVDLTVTIGANA